MNKPIIIIPARYQSTRLPGKPLLLIGDVPLIVYVCSKAAEYIDKSYIYVATDNKEIYHTVIKFGYRCVLTPSDCLTGTDRVKFTANKLSNRFNLNQDQIFINIQGDEPDISPLDIDKVFNAKLNNIDSIITGVSLIQNSSQIKDRNIVKMAFSSNLDLIYASRAEIPHSSTKYYKAFAIYAFTLKELISFSSSNKTYLEEIEDVEILRFLEKGKNVKITVHSNDNFSIDTVEDYRSYIQKFSPQNFPE